MNSDPQPQKGSRVSFGACGVSLLFAALSFHSVSVGWILCCAIAVVSVIFGGIYCFAGIGGNGPRRLASITVVATVLIVAFLLIYSYKHAAAGGL
jgi:hypothetical protein